MRLKILFFPAWYPNRINPIAGQCVKQHANVLKKKNDIAVFFTFGDIELKPLITFNEAKEDGIVVYRSSYKRFPYKLMAPINLLLYFIALFNGYVRVRRSFGVAQINHVHILTRTALLPFLLKLIDKTPFVITEHWSRYLPDRATYNGIFRKALTRVFVRWSSGISAVSPNLRDALLGHKLSSPNFPVICNAIDSQKFDYKAHLMESGTFKFLHVSGMQDKIKNISGMIRACSILKKRGFSFEFHFVGDSEEILDFKQLVIENELQHYVFFHGHIDKGLERYYQMADAFVIFSFFENQPMVIIEAFFCGIPVIASRAGGMSAMITSENGILVESNRCSELADAMEVMIKRELDFDRDKIRSLAIERYSEDAVEQQLIDFYSTALDYPKTIASDKSSHNFA